MTGRELARELIPILDAHLAGNHGAHERILRIVRHLPKEVLLRKAVTYHLGKRRTAALVDIIGRAAR